MFMMIPIEVSVTNILEPPALMKGSAFPVKGSRPTITDIFIRASSPIHDVSPNASRDPY